VVPVEKIDMELCTGCRLCSETCPMDVIHMEAGKPYIRYQEDCVACYDCEQECPVNAIYVSPQRGRPVPHAW
jgi:NAD-dependent dihydropyrimidine dehydrogenase PreA subunit